MDNLDPIAGRLSDALTRIARGLDARPAAHAGDPADFSALQEQLVARDQELRDLRAALGRQADDADEAHALEDDIAQERAEKEELAARVALLQKQLEAQDLKHQKATLRLTQRLDALDVAGQRLQQTNADLRDLNAQLRRASEEGTADAALINRAMQAELDALRAARVVEAEEVGAVFDALSPMLKGAQ